MKCSCCDYFSGPLIKCKYCNRRYHNDCHIPALAENMDINEWKCTMCQDMTKYSKVLTREDFTGFIPESEAKRKIMERILMEFFCQMITTEKFRTSSLNGIIYSDYVDINEPYDLSLNVIKERLKFGQSYSLLIHFLIDMNQLFSNAILYHFPGNPYHDSALKLQNHLETLINRWIPVSRLNEDNF